MSQHIFRKGKKNQLNFVGDFEGLYSDTDDPWGQSGKSNDEPMNQFYALSRRVFARDLRCCQKHINSVIEIGCGTGETTKLISDVFKGKQVLGCDVSEKAIEKARNNYPNLNFQILNILTDSSEKKFDAIVLSNLIWYVLHEPDVLSKNLIDSLDLSKTKDCFVFIQNSLFRTGQGYAADKINSIGTLTDYFIDIFRDVSISECRAQQFDWPTSKYLFGMVSLRLRRN